MRRQDILRELSQQFASGPDVEITIGPNGHTLEHLKASYAYLYDREYKRRSTGWSRFPWDVAYSSLCEIKAHALGLTKTVTMDFYMAFTVKPSFVRNL